jgi:hypothetical protein
MIENNELNFGDDLSEWIMSKCEDWRDHYDTTYRQEHEEYYRLWRGIWAAEDKMRESERSRLISPALQQAVESSVAEIEEATFGRGKWFDIRDDYMDKMQGQDQDMQVLRTQLTEDMDYVKARKNIAECILNAAVFGTGIGELVVEEVTELVPATRPAMDGAMRAIGVEEKSRFVTRLVPVLPQNFLIDPVATNIDEALGVAIDKFVPKHVVEEGIDNGIYFDVDLEDAYDDSKIAFDPEEESSYDSDKVRLTTYYGKVPTDLYNKEMFGDFVAEGEEEDFAEGSYIEVVAVIANEDQLLKLEANPFMMEDRPVVAFAWDNVPSRFWGRGVCEKGYNSQKALDTELRARIDALALTVHPMMAVDASRLPRGAKMEVRPGKTLLTNGNPSEILQPFKFGNLDPNTFNQSASLQQMVQQATGAVDTAGIPSFAGSEATAAGISMSLGAIIKRHKRTLLNFQDSFLVPFVSKAAWRYMQFNPEQYPVADYKFCASSSLGVIAREYEVTQLVQLLQTMSPESPLYPTLIESIVDNMALSNREELIARIKQASQPNPEAQQAQMQMQQLAMAKEQAQLQYMQAQVAEIQSRVQQNNVETQLLPFEAESERIRSMSVGMRDEDPTQKDFEQKAKVAELALKEKDLDIKAEAMRNQMRMARMKDKR